MNRMLSLAFALAVLACPAFAQGRASVSGEYVEARTAEVFTGGCTMNSEAETVGREAVLAWHVTEGGLAGVSLRDLSVVAALAGDRNLGMREMGGEGPGSVRAVLFVDSRADAKQRAALAQLVREATRGLATDIIDVRPTPVRFERMGNEFLVDAGDASLTIDTRLKHDPSCGAMQWFGPLGDMQKASLGVTRSQVYWGSSLGAKWRQVDKRSSFWGTFTLDDEPSTSASQHP